MTSETTSPQKSLAQAIAHELSELSNITAVVLAGSFGNQEHDTHSDIDVYVYAGEIPSIDVRTKLITQRSNQYEIGNHFWEEGDEWLDEASGIMVDMIYRTTEWIEKTLSTVLDDHQASVGYTTAFWHNVKYSTICYDPENWFSQLQDKANKPYPDALKKNIINKNYPILTSTFSSYKSQLKKAFERKDLVSINHRLTAYIASYFDVLFAVNELTHLGEKRLIKYAVDHCHYLPNGFSDDLTLLLTTSSTDANEFLRLIEKLTENLDNLITQLVLEK